MRAASFNPDIGIGFAADVIRGKLARDEARLEAVDLSDVVGVPAVILDATEDMDTAYVVPGGFHLAWQTVNS
ncbi:MAG: hypothetical protein IT356_03890 [Gemmatimonadaceae bacterium]|nr:hypothetical protein [Gemmatimonadaceae bacterium]